VKSRNCLFIMSIVAVCCFMSASTVFSQDLKVGYVNSQKIVWGYKEAQDAQKKFDEINAGWEAEAREMQTRIQELADEIDSQSLLLSEQRKQEKTQEAQNLVAQFQTFQQQKWGQPDGDAYKKEQELMSPIVETIREAIKKIGKDEKYHYIFDSVAGNIVYVSEDQKDLTELVIEELNKGVTTTEKK